MTAPTTPSATTEEALATFLDGLPEASALTTRTLAHAWVHGGGDLHVGRVAVRMTTGSAEHPFTAATLHAPRGPETFPRLELCRAILESHGVSHDDWVHWSDEFADLAHHGFDPGAKFPALTLHPDVSPAEVARLATGLRDLARMAGTG